jgi:hypothetical protein
MDVDMNDERDEFLSLTVIYVSSVGNNQILSSEREPLCLDNVATYQNVIEEAKKHFGLQVIFSFFFFFFFWMVENLLFPGL